jgi:amino acid permease
MASGRSIQFRPVTALLVVLAIALVAVGVVYLTTSADQLPSILPGHQAHLTRHHTKHGIAMFGLAVLALVGAWFTTAPSN